MQGPDRPIAAVPHRRGVNVGFMPSTPGEGGFSIVQLWGIAPAGRGHDREQTNAAHRQLA